MKRFTAIALLLASLSACTSHVTCPPTNSTPTTIIREEVR